MNEPRKRLTQEELRAAYDRAAADPEFMPSAAPSVEGERERSAKELLGVAEILRLCRGTQADRALFEKDAQACERAAALLTASAAPEPSEREREPDAWIAEVFFKECWGAPALYRFKEDAEEHNRMQYEGIHPHRVVPLFRALTPSAPVARESSEERCGFCLAWDGAHSRNCSFARTPTEQPEGAICPCGAGRGAITKMNHRADCPERTPNQPGAEP